MINSIYSSFSNKNYWVIAIFFLAFFNSVSRAYVSLFAVFLPIMWLLLRKESQWRNLSPHSKKILLALYVMLLWQGATIFWSENFAKAMEYFLYYTYWVMLPLMVFLLSKEDIHKVISFFLAGLVFSSILSIGIAFRLWEFSGVNPDNPSPFMFHIEFSVFLAFGALICLQRFIEMENWKNWTSFLYIALFLLLTYNMFITFGRTGQVVFLLGFPVLILLKSRFSIRHLAISFLLISVIFLVAYSSNKTFSERVDLTKTSVVSIFEKQDYHSSLGQRVAAWIVSYHLVKENPWTGVGLGDVEEEFKAIILQKLHQFKNIGGRPTLLDDSHLHNQYLMAVVQSGLIGLGLMLLIIWLLIRMPIADKQTSDLRYVFLLVFFVGTLTEPFWAKQFAMVLFTTMVALFMVSEKKVE